MEPSPGCYCCGWSVKWYALINGALNYTIRLHTRFIRHLGLTPHANGREICRFKDQVQRLFATTITTHGQYTVPGADKEHSQQYFRYQGVTIADELVLWWDPYRPTTSFESLSYLELSDKFYALITDRPIPCDLRTIQALKGSALALDVYSWLVYRLSYLTKPTTIPWNVLQMQFGNNYAQTKGGRYMFKKDFQEQLRAVLQLYSTASARHSR